MTNEPNTQKVSALAIMAARANVEPDKLLVTLKATVFKGASTEELLALVVVANQYGLNPFLREMFGFPNGKGGIVPLVPIDGWTKIVNRQEDFDGVEFEFEEGDDNKPFSCTATMYSKSRTHPIRVTEYYSECHRNTAPWNTMPRRMLRHKAYMQAARVAYGISGIFDEDEARDAVKRAEVEAKAPSDLKFGNAFPDDAIDMTPAALTAGDPIKRKRRTKAEMEAVTQVEPAKEEEPAEEVPPPDAVEPEPSNPLPLALLRKRLLKDEIDEGKLQRYLIQSGYIEPWETLDKLTDEKVVDITNSLDSIVAEWQGEPV